MERFSPKIRIINHFDDLINRIDIDIDNSLENVNDQKLLSELLTSSKHARWSHKDSYDFIDVQFFNEKFHLSKQNLHSWSESMKVIDYLKQVRMKTIEELKKAQEESLEYYTLNSDRFKSELSNETNIDKLKSELFADKFYFQVNLRQSEKRFWTFDVFTFVTDFYLSPSDID